MVGIFGFALPRIADYRDVIDVVSDLTRWEVAALAAATIWNIITFAPPWRAAMPGLGLWRALLMTQASTAAASVFPGGEAVGLGLVFGMLRTWGFRSGAIVAAGAVVTAMNVLAKVLLPVAALAALLVKPPGQPARPPDRDRRRRLGPCSARRPSADGCPSTRAPARLDQWRARLPLLRRRAAASSLPDKLSRFRSETFGLLRDRWGPLLGWTLLGHQRSSSCSSSLCVPWASRARRSTSSRHSRLGR